jgi:sulfatase maturation enzyme AslB (radical SAM superfamily)
MTNNAENTELILTLNVTNDCNLKCGYCISHGYTDRPFDKYDYLKELILSVDKKVNSKYFILNLAGNGEPLLEFNRWKKPLREIIKRMKVVSKKLFYPNIITNFTLLNDEMIEYIIKNNIHIICSYDGDSSNARHYKKNDKSSGVDVLNNLNKMLDMGYNNFTISSVVNRNSYKCLPDIAHFVSKHKICWHFNLDVNQGFDDVVPDIVDHIKQAIDILIENNYDIYNQLNIIEVKLNKPKGCGCANNPAWFFINAKGYIYSGMGDFNTEDIILDPLNQSEAIKGYIENKQHKLNDRNEHNCEWWSYCNGGHKYRHGLIAPDKTNHICYILKEIMGYLSCVLR